MSVIYGYCRVSRPRQNIERQSRNIKSAYPTAIIIEEVHTRTTFTGRIKWERLMKQIRAGDTIVFDSVSRMSGSVEEGVACYKELYSKGIELYFLKEPHINTSVYKQALTNSKVPLTGMTIDIVLEAINRYLLLLAEEQIKLAFAQSEKEVSDLHQRTREGIQTAKLNGKQIGRVTGKKYETQKSKQSKEYIKKMAKDFGGNLKDTDCIALLKITPKTYYKYKRELQEEQDTAL